MKKIISFTKMKKIVPLTMTVILSITALTGCGSNTSGSNNSNNNNGTQSAIGNNNGNNSTADKKDNFENLTNDNPITTTYEDYAPALEYLNQYVYTSDFEANRKKFHGSDYWVYEPNPDRPKLELSNEMKIDDSLTIRLSDDMTEIIETEYFTRHNNPEKEISKSHSDLVNCSNADGKDIFGLIVENFTGEATSRKNCTITEMTMMPAAEYEYLGITTGDSLEKVIKTIGSPNKNIHIEGSKDTNYDVFMYYTDSDKKLTLSVHIRLDLNKPEDNATVYSLSVWDYDLEEHDQDH